MIKVTMPYKEEWRVRARAIGGRWDADAKAWTFPDEARAVVDAALRDIYGVGLDARTRRARIRFKKPVWAYCEPVTVGGVIIARAFGRDSACYLGDGVTLIEGKPPHSGGSRKNWATVVEAGSVFLVEALPEGIESTNEMEVKYED